MRPLAIPITTLVHESAPIGLHPAHEGEVDWHTALGRRASFMSAATTAA
jgi:hypothetical protein